MRESETRVASKAQAEQMGTSVVAPQGPQQGAAAGGKSSLGGVEKAGQGLEGAGRHTLTTAHAVDMATGVPPAEGAEA